MAADRQMTTADGQRLLHTKIRRIKSPDWEVLIGTAGDVEAGEHIIEWYKWKTGVDKGLAEYPSKEDLHALILDSTGDCVWYGPKVFPIDVKERFHVIGSGSGFAIGALYAGATVIEAIRIANKLDSTSGFGVQFEGFGKHAKNSKSV